MSVLQKSVTAGLVALSLTSALLATAPAAEARDDFWAGVAAGAVGGIIGGAIASQPRGPIYQEPVYVAPPPPPRRVVYEERAYYRPAPAPRCHFEWQENQWGDAYRVRVCPAY
ncbi:hypothetical protein [Rhizobium sp. FY34]|uniref:hypothetical protein n=1 Tax=Rhizobium sp. FY34 TaxID=2562309 RepID=UPI0010C02CF9|nr:hypothetical protein [Rhizobium sp. FY34]